MRKIICFSIIVLLASNMYLTLNAQVTSKPVLKILLKNKELPNKSVDDKEKKYFTVENLSPEQKIEWQNSVKEHSFVKSISFSETDNSNIQNGEIIIKLPNDMANIRKLIEGFGLTEFYVGDVRILTKTLLNNEEAQKKAMEFVFKDFVFTKECNDSTLIDYYDFQIYHLSAKIQVMWSNDYSKFLFDGNVTTYTENLDKMIIRRENFKKNIK